MSTKTAPNKYSIICALKTVKLTCHSIVVYRVKAQCMEACVCVI